MTQEECRRVVRGLIHQALSEMVEKIRVAARKNMEGREHNPFNCFQDANIGKYMMLGRSFDSQLGNRLQILAFHLARLRYGELQVPNVLYVQMSDSTHKIRYQRYSLYQTRSGAPLETQRLVLGTEEQAFRAKGRVRAGAEWSCELTETVYKQVKDALKGRKKDGGPPVDLMFWPNEDQPYCEAFEIKAGGHLDTKNAEANHSEVLFLQQAVRPLGGRAYFATCYNNAGEGNAPAGSIFTRLGPEQLCVGRAFWEKVLPAELTYEAFIELYQTEFNVGIDMSRQLREIRI